MQRSNSIQPERISARKSLSAKDSQDAGNLVNILLLAWKNCGLYPEGHATARKTLENLRAAFESYFSSHGDLRLTIERNRFLRGTTVLYEVSSDNLSEDMVFLLYRDGMQWLEFQQGLPLEELTYFFNIINKYRVLVEETEGDIVTGLIDGDMDHIHFKAADIFWQDFPLLDFSRLNNTLPETEEFAYQIELDAAQQLKGQDHIDIAKSIADPSISDALWEISPTEQEELQKMVLDEENWDNTEDVFDVLLVILRSQTDRYNFSSVLDFTLEEVVETIEQGEFGLLLNLFQSLHQLLYRDASDELGWISPLINRFFQDLSSPEIFDLVTGKLMMLNDSDAEKINALRQTLLYFSPAVILALGPVIVQTRSEAVQRMIMEVIEYLCLRDMVPLEKILDHPDKILGEKLLTLLTKLKGERTNQIFFKMTQHPSEKVRREAVRVLIARDPNFVPKLFPLIDDPNDEIRRDILIGIGKQKSSVLENMLLKYVKEGLDNKDQEHILACYGALGRCGSAASIPFLQRILLGQGWNRFKKSGKLIHRQGAAIALALLDTWQAKDILLTASKSRFQVIREAFHRAMVVTDTPEVQNNG